MENIKKMSKPVKILIIVTAIALMAGASGYAATGAGEKGDIGESRARQIALAEVPGATDGDITKFRKGMDDNRLEYDIEIIYGGYEYDSKSPQQTVPYLTGARTRQTATAVTAPRQEKRRSIL